LAREAEEAHNSFTDVQMPENSTDMSSTRGDSQRASGEYGMIPVPTVQKEEDNAVVGSNYGAVGNDVTDYKSLRGPHEYDRVEEPRSQYAILKPVHN
jgi:hypothetical protein